MFFGELWRGRDNLRVTFSGPRTFRHLRSALVPIIDLALIALGVVALLTLHPVIALALWALAIVPAGIKAALMVRRQLRRGVVASAQAFAVAVVFDLARAFALLAKGSHRARRTA